MSQQPTVHPLAPQASSRYATIRELLEASLAQKPIPSAQYSLHQVFHFADPAFRGYLIRITQGINAALKTTTSLIPPEWIFHGPNMGGTLLEGRDADDRHAIQNGISITLEQPGESFADIIKASGPAGLVERLAAHPEKLERLFRIVAFAGAHTQTTTLDTTVPGELWNGAIDLHAGNIFMDAEGNLSLIDQMSPEDHVNTATLGKGIDSIKAALSILRLDAILNEYLKEGGYLKNIYLKSTDGSGPNPRIARLEEAIYANSQRMLTILENGRTWADLKTQLSDKGKEAWRGVESPGPVFARTDSTAALTAIPIDRLDIDRASPQELLDVLHAMREKTLSR